MVRFGVNSCGFVKNKTAPYRDSLLFEIWISDSAPNEKSCFPVRNSESLTWLIANKRPIKGENHSEAEIIHNMIPFV